MLVLVVSVLVRAGLLLTYPPAEGNDTPTYQHLANSIRNNQGFERYNGTRTPGYPLFLMLTGTPALTSLVQTGLGLLTTLLVFYITWLVSQRAWLAGLMALAHTLNLGQLFFEGTLLSEAVATFLLFVCLAGLAKLWYGSMGEQPHKFKNWWLAAVLGLAAASLALTRPLFAFIPFWGAFFLLFFWRGQAVKIRLVVALVCVLPALVTLLLWVNFIYTRFHILGMDSIGGYHLVNHTTSFFELAPEEYAPIRDTFLTIRAQRLARTGSTINTIWDAIPPLMDQTKLNYYALGRQMGRISSRLISEHPWLYMQKLALGWWWFWRVGVLWFPDTISNTTLSAMAKTVMLLERITLFGINLLFLGGSFGLLWPKIRTWFKMDLFTWFALSAVWMTSILQTLAEHGDNPRFLAPLQSLVVIVVTCWLVNTFSAWNSTKLPQITIQQEEA